MKNKNVLLAVVFSVALIAVHSYIMRRYYPEQPAAQPQAQEAPKPAPAPTAPAVPAVPVVPPVAGTGKAIPPLDPKARITLENSQLALTWRKQDGALVQAVWKKDGTHFFPDEKRSQKDLSMKDFDGMGSTAGTFFDGDPQVEKVEGFVKVNFMNSEGEKLSYALPEKGHVLQVAWNSPKGNKLQLVKRPADEFAATGMSRVFSFEEKEFESVEWISTLKEPWFGKKKEIPVAKRFVGVDAGVEDQQRNYYFAAIWDVKNAKIFREVATGYQVASAEALLYLGPKQADSLAAFAKPCKQVMDFGFFGLVAQIMFMVLLAIQSLITNWGWAIAAFGILIRLALWPFNTKTTVMALRGKELEPHQKVIQAKYEKFGKDMQKKAEMQKEVMAFYKKNGHNPMGGCLPMLLQMPIFMALWSMLSAVFELRQASWTLWIQDLSRPDKFYVLPILLGASMIIQQKQTPTVGDPAQKKMMMIMMPAMMVFMFANFPAGLNLYYLAFNIVGMGQAWWVTKNYKSQPVVV